MPFITAKNLDEYNVRPEPSESSQQKPKASESTSESVSEEQSDEEDKLVDTRFDCDDSTLSTYLDDIRPEKANVIEKIGFHAKSLSKVVADIKAGGYLVKQRCNGRVKYTHMGEKDLDCLLKKMTVRILFPHQPLRQMRLDRILKRPEVCLKLTKFEEVDFFSDAPGVFNLWRGFAYDVSKIAVVNMALIQPFLDHVRNVICARNDDAYQTELKKNAWIVQNPSGHLGYATVLLSEEGSGKNTYTDMICSFWGGDFTASNITSMETVTCDNHAEAIAYKKIVVLNEVISQESSKASFDVMKSRITDPEYMVRSLYQTLRVVKNVNNYFILSQHEAVKVGRRDRRYHIMEVSEEHLQDIPYFAALTATFTNEMRAHLLKFFLEMDISDFDPRSPPMTDIKEEIQEAQKPLPQMFMEQFDWKDSTGFERREKGMTIDDIYTDGFLPYCRRFQIEQKFICKPGGAFGRKIKPFVRQETRKYRGGTHRVYFPLDDR
jgi:hypothetical protein